MTSPRRMPAFLCACLLACAGLLAALVEPAAAELDVDFGAQVELDDVMEVERVDRNVIAFDLLANSTSTAKLELGETLLYSEASGRVALALTDRRALAASPTSGGWREVRYQLHEEVPRRAQLGKRVALVVSDRRALGFDGGSGLWIGFGFGPQETPLSARVGDGTAVVLTNRRAIGLSPDIGRFAEAKLDIHESVGQLRVRSNTATVSTDQRLLVFNAPSGVWTETKRDVN